MVDSRFAWWLSRVKIQNTERGEDGVYRVKVDALTAFILKHGLNAQLDTETLLTVLAEANAELSDIFIRKRFQR